MHPKASNIRTCAIAAIAATLSLAAPSSVSALSAPKTETLESLGSAESNQTASEGLFAEAHAAERSDNSFLSVTWSVENRGNQATTFNWPSGTTYIYSNSLQYSGVTVTSSDGDSRYHPIMDSNGECLCSGKTSFDFKDQIGPGEQVAYWSMYSVPEDVDAITLEIPGFEPIEDIPIS